MAVRLNYCESHFERRKPRHNLGIWPTSRGRATISVLVVWLGICVPSISAPPPQHGALYNYPWKPCVDPTKVHVISLTPSLLKKPPSPAPSTSPLALCNPSSGMWFFWIFFCLFWGSHSLCSSGWPQTPLGWPWICFSSLTLDFHMLELQVCATISGNTVGFLKACINFLLSTKHRMWFTCP